MVNKTTIFSGFLIALIRTQECFKASKLLLKRKKMAWLKKVSNQNSKPSRQRGKEAKIKGRADPEKKFSTTNGWHHSRTSKMGKKKKFTTTDNPQGIKRAQSPERNNLKGTEYRPRTAEWGKKNISKLYRIKSMKINYWFKNYNKGLNRPRKKGTASGKKTEAM